MGAQNEFLGGDLGPGHTQARDLPPRPCVGLLLGLLHRWTSRRCGRPVGERTLSNSLSGASDSPYRGLGTLTDVPCTGR